MASRRRPSVSMATRYHAFAAIFGTASRPARFVERGFGPLASPSRDGSDGG
jgi:hypothetical protein